MSGLPVWNVSGVRFIHAPGKRKLALISHCEKGDIIVTTVVPEEVPDCVFLTPRVLRQTGSLAVAKNGNLATARQLAGHRLWTDWQPEGNEITRLRSLMGQVDTLQ